MSTGQQQYWWGANEEELDLDDALAEIDSRRENAKPEIHWREALELNKERSECILCGGPTHNRALLGTVLKYCACVEKYKD